MYSKMNWQTPITRAIASNFWRGLKSAFIGGCVAKTHRGTRWMKPYFLFSLGSHPKQAGDERHLIGDVLFSHTMHLSFSYHVHALVSL